MSRKWTALSLGDKLNIIKEAEKWHGATKASIARDLKIPESSLKTILANKVVILQNANKFGLKRKAAKEGQHEKLEKFSSSGCIKHGALRSILTAPF
ncbi:hypothetical protein V5799_012668 [Amblyomma americanum]|uniref:HTH psq-type domain-containing protein n=1 Tax=Amblyomma americanum TaxID=6943 RepID=A0AAQ4EDV7_AMBAM